MVADFVVVGIVYAHLDNVTADQRPDEPIGQQTQAPIPCRHIHHQQHAPHEPRKQAAHLPAAKLAHSCATADGCPLPQSFVGKRPWFLPAHHPQYVLGHHLALLHRPRRIGGANMLGGVVGVGDGRAIPRRPDVGLAGHTQRGVGVDTAAFVMRHGQSRHQRGGLFAHRTNHGAGGDALPIYQPHFKRRDPCDAAVDAHLDPQFGHVAHGVSHQLGVAIPIASRADATVKLRQNGGAGGDEQHAALLTPNVLVLALGEQAAQIGNFACYFGARIAATCDDKGE